MAVRVFGIRHHGPGSARSLRRALDEYAPDAVLIEGPPDADGIIGGAAHDEMKPPVAILVYRPDVPKQAVYYPFAAFSPEWQAIRWALARGVPVRFMDLPQAIELGSAEPRVRRRRRDDPSVDPLGVLGSAAGYQGDTERWWEHVIEESRAAGDVFESILEAMAALRAESSQVDLREQQREAHMRLTIRATKAERVAVVCGAWHAPVLVPPAWPTIASDEALLKKLPRVKVAAAWVPWTHGRLAADSGYGAGIESPGWYHHLFTVDHDVSIRWMTRVARLLRKKDLDASAAQVIDAVRLAESIAALRGRSLPGLSELGDAAQATLAGGRDEPMRLVHRELVVGETLGSVPADTPLVPLAQDLTREQKRLRLPAQVQERVLDLDLRKPNERARSSLLHRLSLLGIEWGERDEESFGGMGTFHEIWRLSWQPELALALIEAGVWGNTVVDAATARAKERAARAAELGALTELLDRVLLADLAEATAAIMARLEVEAALASDVAHLMRALPPLARVARYGDVRKTDAAQVEHVVNGLVVRICVGLEPAVSSLDDAAATSMVELIDGTASALALLEKEELRAAWMAALARVAALAGVHGRVAGRVTRMLLDGAALDRAEAARRAGLALSTAVAPDRAASWVEGFLKGSGLLIVHDDELWGVVDRWIQGLPARAFGELMPLLRRTFATFAAGERRQIGEKVKKKETGTGTGAGAGAGEEFDHERAALVMGLVERIMG